MMANLQGVAEACQGVHEDAASKAWIVAIVVVLSSLQGSLKRFPYWDISTFKLFLKEDLSG